MLVNLGCYYIQLRFTKNRQLIAPSQHVTFITLISVQYRHNFRVQSVNCRGPAFSSPAFSTFWLDPKFVPPFFSPAFSTFWLSGIIGPPLSGPPFSGPAFSAHPSYGHDTVRTYTTLYAAEKKHAEYYRSSAE